MDHEDGYRRHVAFLEQLRGEGFQIGEYTNRDRLRFYGVFLDITIYPKDNWMGIRKITISLSDFSASDDAIVSPRIYDITECVWDLNALKTIMNGCIDKAQIAQNNHNKFWLESGERRRAQACQALEGRNEF